MNSNTVNISFRKDLLRQIDKIAKEEFRSRSELIREAARMYIERKSRWNTIFCLGGDLAKKRGLAESDVVAEIAKHRKAKKASS